MKKITGKRKYRHFSAAYFMIATLIFIHFASTRSLAQEDPASNADWMSENKELLKDKVINQVTLLGSHDSASCDIHVGSPAVKGYLTHSGKHKKGSAAEKDVGSAVCQSATIKEQLEYGVRHIDLRVAYQDGQYWLSHMYISTPAFGPGGVFTQIKDFIAAHPDEVILMIGEHLYSEKEPMTADEADEFYGKLEDEFGDLLVKSDNFSTLTYGKIWEGSGRVILIAADETGWGGPAPYQEKHKHKHSKRSSHHKAQGTGSEEASTGIEITDDLYLWDGHAVDSRWMDEKDPDTLISELKPVVEEWRSGKNCEKLRRLQAMTTTGHKLETAKKTNARVREMMQGEWKDAPISVLQVDDAVNSGLMPLLIKKIRNP
jgi:hypothetical protein